MDKEDFSQLEQNFEITIGIQPQMSMIKKVEMEEMKESLEDFMTNCSLVVFILQIVSSLGLKYLWNIMNLLQFLLYMQMWMIKLPPLTQTFLQELKAIAFMDFIPKKDIQNVIKEKLGLEEDSSDSEMQVENSANA